VHFNLHSGWIEVTGFTLRGESKCPGTGLDAATKRKIASAVEQPVSGLPALKI
jgi:hypothetical protein